MPGGGGDLDDESDEAFESLVKNGSSARWVKTAGVRPQDRQASNKNIDEYVWETVKVVDRQNRCPYDLAYLQPPKNVGFFAMLPCMEAALVTAGRSTTTPATVNKQHWPPVGML